MSASPEGSLILRPIRLVGYRSYVGFAEPLVVRWDLNPRPRALPTELRTTLTQGSICFYIYRAPKPTLIIDGLQSPVFPSCQSLPILPLISHREPLPSPCCRGGFAQPQPKTYCSTGGVEGRENGPTRRPTSPRAIMPRPRAGKWGVEPHTSSLTMRHSADELRTQNPTAFTGGRENLQTLKINYEKTTRQNCR